MSNSVRVRFAPSPTGALHVGGARTAIYNWAFARRMGGTFILRIDDTDPERSTAENTAQILRSLQWLGLNWDEGPALECNQGEGSTLNEGANASQSTNEYGPYFQSQRTANYQAALECMKERGSVYPCFCSAEELAAKREAARACEGAQGYDRTCRRLDSQVVNARIAAGEPHVWRLAISENHDDVVVNDAVRGELVFPISAMDDLILVRNDGTPTYNFATVVDDANMKITHVIRGDDHLSNTPRQVLIYEALGCPAPHFAHLSMIWGADGKKLSKRHGATSVEAFREEGYLPEALLNYLALLGWSLDGETTIVSREMLTSNFSLERISKNPAIFDFEKLEWMNGVYIREMSPEVLIEKILPLLKAAGLVDAEEEDNCTTADGGGDGAVTQSAKQHDWYLDLVPLVSERLKHLNDIVPMVRFLFTKGVEIDPSAAAKTLAKDGATDILALVYDKLTALDSWILIDLEEALRKLPEIMNLKPKQVFQVIRVAITGSLVSLPLFESIALLGKEETLARIEKAQGNAG